MEFRRIEPRLLPTMHKQKLNVHHPNVMLVKPASQ